MTGEAERVKEVCVPGAPGSSIQFQADWKNLRGNRAAQVTYFKVSPTGWCRGQPHGHNCGGTLKG